MPEFLTNSATKPAMLKKTKHSSTSYRTPKSALPARPVLLSAVWEKASPFLWHRESIQRRGL